MVSIECIFLDSQEQVVFVRQDATRFVVSEKEYNLDALFPLDDGKQIQTGMLIGFRDIDGNFVFYEIKETQIDPFDDSVSVYAEHAAMTELSDETITDKRMTNTQAGAAVMQALSGTRWTLNTAEDAGVASCRFWYCSAWSALQKVAEKWGCSIEFTWQVGDVGIIARNVNVKTRSGAWRGKRFELPKGITSLKVVYDDSSVVTALYGRGRGEEMESLDGGSYYGKKISFADVVWSKANGDPADKPAGQEWVEDVEATAAYGRAGRKRSRVIDFSDCTDPEELLELTWAALQKAKTPLVTVRGTVTDLERVWGYNFEAIRMGDTTAVVIDKISLAIFIDVVDIKRDYLNPENTAITLGNEIVTIADIQAQTSTNLNRVTENAAFGAQVAAANPGLLKSYLDTMATHIMSSGTNMYTDPADGSLVFENPTGTEAVKITGAGILIADEKVGGEWQWGTAITGAGMTADVVTSGTLQATLIRILGTDRFYWDAGNIHIFDPENTNNEIRIGIYDGVNYGIGFTRDGGATWKSAIDFNGAHVTAEDRYSGVTISPNSLVFMANAQGVCVAKSYTCRVYAYTGNQQVIPEVASITGAPAGMTVSAGAVSNYTIPITVTVPAGSTLGSAAQQSGTITVNIEKPVETTVDIAWCKVNAGTDGIDGTDGVNGQDGRNGKDGADAYSTVSIQLYRRATSLPTQKPGDCSYNFASGTLTGTLNGWSRSIPSGDATCYGIVAVAISNHPQITITTDAWSTPLALFRNGVDGTNGTDGKDGTNGTDGAPGKDGTNGTNGTSHAVINLYQRKASVPTAIQSSTVYTFATDSLTNADGSAISTWSRSFPSGSNPCYITSATVLSANPSVAIPAASWSQPILFVQNGANGTNGKDGADGAPGKDGVDGKDGKDGTGVTILGSYDTETELDAAHPTGSPGDSYIVNGDLYIWSATDAQWKNVGRIQGPAGENGLPGAAGADGKSSYFHHKYSPVANPSASQMTEVPAEYIGTYVDYIEADSTDPADYNWFKWQGTDGKDGTPGVNGSNGQTSYMHVKYSNDGGTTFTADEGEAVGYYMGTYVDFTEADSLNPSSYKWVKIKGENGANGAPGANGTPGADGADGEDGINNAVVYLYKRAATPPAKPSAPLQYTFITATVSGTLDGWSQSIPSTDGNPCWVTLTQAAAKTSTVSIAPSAWTAPAKLVEDGDPGAKTYYQDTAPANPRENDLWVNSAEDNKLYRYNGTAWQSIQDLNIPDIKEQLLAASASLSVLSKSIESKVSATYLQQETQSLQTQISNLTSTIQQTEKDLRAAFETEVLNATGEVDTKYSTLIRASGDGVEIGRTDSNFRTRLSNEKLSFVEVDDGTETEVAYISNKRLYITDARVTHELSIGEANGNNFAWVKTSTGLSLRYVSA